MDLSKIPLPEPIVPNVIPAGRPITQDILDHIHTRIDTNQGVLIFDTTGLLSKIVCHQLPRTRAKEVFLYNAALQDKRSMAINFLTPYEGEGGATLAGTAVELFHSLYGPQFSEAETQLLELSVEVLHDVLTQTPEWETQLLSPLTLATFLIDQDYRHFVSSYVRDVRLKMVLEDPFNEFVAYQLCTKLKFVTDDPRFTYGINRAIEINRMHGEFDMADVHRQGKIAIVELHAENLTPWLRQYIVEVFFSRFQRSAPSDFDLEAAYFFSGSYSMERDYLSEPPVCKKEMRRIIQNYCGMRFGRRPDYLQADQADFLTARYINKIDPILNTRSLFDPELWRTLNA